MRSRPLLQWSLALTLWFTPPAFAQSSYDPVLDPTVSPLRAYHGSDIDSIELSTGMLSLKIPLVSLPQRGGVLHLDYSLTYKGVAGISSAALTPYTIPYDNGLQLWMMSSFGQLFGVPASSGTSISLPNFPSQIKLIHTQTGTSSSFTQGWLLEQDGSSHTLGFMTYTPTTTQARTLDGTGFYVNMPASGSPTFVDKNGVTTITTSSATTVTDRNGNQITFANTGTTTDTMGRQIPPAGCPSNSACFPGVNGTSENFVFGGTSNLQTVTLPNNSVYSFQFTPTNLPILHGQTSAQTLPLLTMVTLPTGGSISYTYSATLQGTVCGNGVNYYFPVLSRSVNANDGTGPHTWTYVYTNSSTTSATTKVTDPVGNVTVYTYGLTSCEPYPTQIQRYDNNNHLLQTETRTYTNAGTVYGEAPFNVNQTSTTVLWPNGQEYKKSYAYDRDLGNGFQFGIFLCNNYPNEFVCNASNFSQLYNPLPAGYTSVPWTVTDSDYGSGSPGPTLRQTKTTYVAFNAPNASSYLANNLLDLPYTVQVLNASGGQAANTQYGYDESPSPSCACGNQTSDHQWLNTTGGTVSTTKIYNSTGTVSSSKDANGNQTSYTYSSTYSSAYPTATTNALNQATNYAYDFNTGLLTSITDPNSRTTVYSYDNMLRLAQTNYPDGGQSTFNHQETSFPYTATVTKKMNSSQNFIQTSVFDGLGRVTETQLNSDPDCQSGDKTDTTYDALGRVLTVSNPYCIAGEPTSGLTTYAYDALSRTIQVTNPDGTFTKSLYMGPAAETTDEGNGNGSQVIQRISQTDGLGRLAFVCEVAPGPFVGPGGASSSSLIGGTSGTPNPCNLLISGTGFLTTYQFDPLDNLLKTIQNGIATRAFAYDSLSRLTSSTNPESNTQPISPYTVVPTTYSYDANGNLQTKIAPAPNQTGTATVTTTYQYDALNRLTQKSFSDGTTPTSTYFYDSSTYFPNNTNTIGRLVYHNTTSSAGGCIQTISEYDAMGRVSEQWQKTPQGGCSNAYPLPYTYDQMGNMISFSNGYFNGWYPFYNSAGRLLYVNAGTYELPPPTNVISGMHYNAAGQIVLDTLGDGETETFVYSKRLRLQSNTATLNGAAVYSFNLTFAPNGDITTSNDSVNGNWNYSYDQFNRLVCSNLATNGICASPTNGTPTYSYVYDRFGNRWQQNGPYTMAVTFTGNATTNNNRVDRGTLGYTYDTAGNQLSDGTHTYAYDAENHLISVDNGATASYLYDAEGRRVHRNSAVPDTCDNSLTHDYIYDLAGHWLTEVNANGTACKGQIYAGNRHLLTYAGDVLFNHQDWLGTERLAMDYTLYNGQHVSSNCTSLPFGDALACTGGLSTLHFTGKERDPESGLDNFGARYNSSNFGRFISADDTAAENYEHDPQGLNLYSYVQNNPINATDPDGHDCVFVVGNTAGLQRGDCSNAPDNATNVTYVPGTVDSTSGQYNRDTGTLTVHYTPYGDTGTGLAVIAGVTPTHPGPTEFQKFASRMAAGADNVNAFVVQVGIQVAAGAVGRALGAGANALLAARSAREAVDLVNITAKIARQMGTRGWTKDLVVDTIAEAGESGSVYQVVNKATGGAATEYVASSTGKFVVVDNATKQILQVSGPGFLPNHLVP